MRKWTQAAVFLKQKHLCMGMTRAGCARKAMPFLPLNDRGSEMGTLAFKNNMIAEFAGGPRRMELLARTPE
jgi:hypothetical protein